MNDSLDDLKECLVIIIDSAIVVLSDRAIAKGTSVLSLRDFTEEKSRACVRASYARTIERTTTRWGATPIVGVKHVLDKLFRRNRDIDSMCCIQ